MKAFGLLCLFLLLETTAFMYSSKGGAGFNTGNDAVTWIVKSRKLTLQCLIKNVLQISDMDYQPIDPVPRSKVSIRPGPVMHGSPLLPYIPKPCPSPRHGGYNLGAFDFGIQGFSSLPKTTDMWWRSKERQWELEEEHMKGVSIFPVQAMIFSKQ
ncbi:UvrABC system protein A [Striga asiatica]|uniref:UvrABC system protein A n=1 Tax=Striga asiatica TaxID=4170 RepID=A0A5A7PY94_STRAF|nr:UvrABC system protein A [Striga asiatica]